MQHLLWQGRLDLPIYLQGSGHCDYGQLDQFPSDKKFRKATSNMKLALWALKDVIDQHQLSEDPGVGLYLGTSHGELSATCDFLKFLSTQQRARPLLFQNSLHHSTLGLLCQHYQITGPGYTLSQGNMSGVAALEAALIALHLGQIHTAIVVGVDSIPSELMASFSHLDSTMSSGGAGCLLLSTNTSTIQLKELRVSSVQTSQKTSPTHFDADFLAVIARELVHHQSTLISQQKGNKSIELELRYV